MRVGCDAFGDPFIQNVLQISHTPQLNKTSVNLVVMLRFQFFFGLDNFSIWNPTQKSNPGFEKMEGIGYFQNLWNFFEKVFGKCLDFWVESLRNFFGGFYWRNFFDGIVWEEFFGRNFLGEFFGEEFFGRNCLVEINKELMFLSKISGNFV